MKKEQMYKLGEDIIKQDGTRVYTIDEKIDEILGTPVYKSIFKGTKEECLLKLEELNK
jgi:hypothetical protein